MGNSIFELHQNLYHYTTAQSCMKILENMTFRMGPMYILNDPKESKKWRFTFYSKSPDSNSNFRSDLFDQVSNFFTHRSLIACFSTDNPLATIQSTSLELEMGCGHPRMWAQYSDNHRGVCLIFRKDPLHSCFADKLGGHEKLYSGNVMYVESGHLKGDYYGIKYFEDVVENSEQFLQSHLRKYAGGLYFTKHKNWKEESEFRYIFHSENEEPVFIPIRESLVGVILGNDCSELDRQLIHNLCLQSNKHTFMAHWRGWEASILQYDASDETISLNGLSFRTDVPCGGVFSQAVNHKGKSKTVLIGNDGTCRFIDH